MLCLREIDYFHALLTITTIWLRRDARIEYLITSLFMTAKWKQKIWTQFTCKQHFRAVLHCSWFSSIFKKVRLICWRQSKPVVITKASQNRAMESLPAYKKLSKLSKRFAIVPVENPPSPTADAIAHPINICLKFTYWVVASGGAQIPTMVSHPLSCLCARICSVLLAAENELTFEGTGWRIYIPKYFDIEIFCFAFCMLKLYISSTC